MIRKGALILSIGACLALLPSTAHAGADRGQEFSPGAAGIGDPYFPLRGNGGYDVQHYLLDVRYDPQSDILTGNATIRARATQNLSSFNLDLDGLTVRSVTVDGRRATWSRDGGELTVVPRKGLRERRQFTTVVRYDGVPETINDEFGISGFLHTDDGAVVIGEPLVASTWFPVNDHPSDKASYTFRVTVPNGLEAVANGVLVSRRTRGAEPRGPGGPGSRWPRTWPPRRSASSTCGPTAAEGSATGTRWTRTCSPRLHPRTGEQFALSQAANSSYKRLSRTISVPAGGAECLSG